MSASPSTAHPCLSDGSRATRAFAANAASSYLRELARKDARFRRAARLSGLAATALCMAATAPGKSRMPSSARPRLANVSASFGSIFSARSNSARASSGFPSCKWTNPRMAWASLESGSSSVALAKVLTASEIFRAFRSTAPRSMQMSNDLGSASAARWSAARASSVLSRVFRPIPKPSHASAFVGSKPIAV